MNYGLKSIYALIILRSYGNMQIINKSIDEITVLEKHGEHKGIEAQNKSMILQKQYFVKKEST